MFLPELHLVATLHVDESDPSVRPLLSDMLGALGSTFNQHRLGQGMFPVANADGDLEVWVVAESPEPNWSVCPVCETPFVVLTDKVAPHVQPDGAECSGVGILLDEDELGAAPPPLGD